MKKSLNVLRIAMLACTLILVTSAFMPVPADARDIVGACWEPGGSACSVTTSCGVGCTQTQNYKNWIIIISAE